MHVPSYCQGHLGCDPTNGDKDQVSEDATILKDFIEQDRVYDFLVGLNLEFDQVRIQILGKQENMDSSAMVAGSGNNSATNMERVLVSGNGRSSKPKTQNRDYKDNLWCTYCKKAHHTRKFPFSIGLNVLDITFANSWVIDSGIGDVKISPSLMLKNVHHDEDSGRMIGHAREWDRLYYLKAPNVTFHEQESYFTIPYLQGKNSFELVLPDQPEPVPENPKSAPENVRFDKVFSRKKTVVPKSVQVQDFNLNSKNKITISNPSLQSESHVNNDDQDLPIAVRKGIRECTNQPLYPLTHFLSFKKFSPSHKAFLVSLNTISIPTTVSEALTNEKWKQAMNMEMKALEKNKTWELVKLPTGKKLVGCKWVYTMKFRVDGLIERYKARLVAKGYTQTYEIDYQETFVPVAKMNTVRVLLSLATNYNWDLQQFDVKNAFLHGELEEEIYMEVSPSYDNNLTAHIVCKLKKVLYGLNQSPQAWFGRFARVMITMGYRQSQGDHMLFIKHSSLGGLTALLVYVDDIIVTGNYDKERWVLNQCLAKEFEIKALGRLKYFLGIEVAHSKQGIFISQQKYVTDLLKETGKTACKPASTPIDPNLRLGEA
ncbi:Retrovirus-related Pol polyprotein from transposon RE1 [Vitis vinifera]|uniref:Retrovirus-related Pol polyprotein from transposon RE1 n=1 Tax=Vitis vinifera TaxID=29760 RepID=A0A438DRR5_VITVI|nr:Retrovirus-related Pol polyprotein from transposon RE1 [Vitis vinifera]